MRPAIAVVGALATAFGALTLSAGSAEADSVTSLPSMSYVHQVLVDDSAGYVFISEGFFSDSIGTTGGGIVVTDLAGKYVGTLDAGHAAEGIAIDGGTLYAALDADAAVAAIDISTIAQPKPKQTLIPLDHSYDLPYDLALQGGKLWVSYNEGTFPGAIGEINVAAATPAFTPTALPDPGWDSAPDLAADPDDHGFLAAAEPGEDPAHMATYNVAAKPPVMLAKTSPPSTFDDCPGGELGLALTAGGGTVLAICDGLPGALAFDTDSLAPIGTYGASPNHALAGAVAVASDGRIAVAAAGGDVALSYIRTLTASGAALNTYESGFSTAVMTNGLAWSANDTKLYAVLVTTQEPLVFSLRIIDNAVSPAVSLTGPSQAGYGTPVALSGTVKTGSIAPAKGATVTISRTSGSTGPVTQFSASTAVDGSFTFTDKTHPVPGKYTYTATYGLTTSAPRTVVVRPEQAAVAMTLHGFYKTSRHGSVVYHLYHHTAKVSAAVHVTPVRPGECVRLQLQEFYRGKWVGRLRTKCAALSRKGEVTTAIPAKKAAIGHPYRLRADFIPGHDTTVRSAPSDWQYIMTKS